MTNLNTAIIDDNDVLFFASELNHCDHREFDAIISVLSFVDIFHCNTSIDRGHETYYFNVY